MNPHCKSRYVKCMLWLMFHLILAVSVVFADSEGKMPITTSSEEAREAYKQGMQFLDTAQPESARPLFEKALNLDPNFILAIDGLRRCAPSFKVARELFQKMMDMTETVNMSDGERLYMESMIAGFNGDAQGQQEKLEKLVEMHPEDERALYNLGRFHFGTNDSEAVRVFRSALKVNPDFVPVYNLLGYSLRALGDNTGAEEAFKTAIKLNPSNPNAYDSYAELLLKLGRFDESIAHYDKALQHEPLFPSAQIGVAANLILKKDYKPARERLSSLFAIAPHDGIRSGIHWALAVTYADEGNFESALKELERNYALSKKNEDAGAMALDSRNMAAILIEMGEFDMALEKFKHSLQLNLNDPNQSQRGKDFARAFEAYNKGMIAAFKHDFSAAKSNAAQFKERIESLSSPFMVQRWHELNGTIALEEKQYQKAIDELQQANATEAYNMYRMALAYEGLGDTRNAQAMYHYVTTYNSPLNFNFSFVRHKAEKNLARISN